MSIKQKHYPADITLQDIQVINRYAGRFLLQLRREYRMSGELLGGLVGLSQQQVSRYERGQSSLSLPQLILFASVFNLSPGQFVSGLYSLMLSDLGNTWRR